MGDLDEALRRTGRAVALEDADVRRELEALARARREHADRRTARLTVPALLATGR